MIDETYPSTEQEDDVIDFLRRSIDSFDEKMLGSFLTFVTEYCVCSSKKICVHFNIVHSVARRPTLNTCGSILHLPTTYESYTAFESEFNTLLSAQELWSFDWF